MTKVKSLIQTVGLVVAGCCAVAPAHASIVKYTIGNGGLENFNLSMDGANLNGVLAGGISITQNPAGNNATVPASYITVCTDIEATLYLGSTYKYNTPPNPFSGLTGIDPTWGANNTAAGITASGIDVANAQQAIQNAAFIFNTFGNLTANHTGMSGSLSQLAGVQLAVWEVLYDTTSLGTVNAGQGSRFQINAGGDAQAVADANSYIAALNASATAGNFGYTGFLLFPTDGPGNTQGNADGQPPQELLMDAASFSPVPEPSTVLAGLLLLLPFGASTTRFLRKNRNA